MGGGETPAGGLRLIGSWAPSTEAPPRPIQTPKIFCKKIFPAIPSQLDVVCRATDS